MDHAFEGTSDVSQSGGIAGKGADLGVEEGEGDRRSVAGSGEGAASRGVEGRPVRWEGLDRRGVPSGKVAGRPARTTS